MWTPSYPELHAEISQLGSAELPPWLAVALHDAQEGRSRAVLHPLGFICIPALRFAGGGVCVHLWAPWFRSEKPTTSPIHSHSWDLYSIVVAGRLRNHLLRVAPTPSARASHRVFQIHSAADEDRIDPTPMLVSSHTAARAAYAPGETYAVPAGQFHMTRVPGSNAVTVVLARNRPEHVDLSLGPVDAPSHRVRRRLCTSAQSALAAREASRLLGRSPTRPYGRQPGEAATSG